MPVFLILRSSDSLLFLSTVDTLFTSLAPTDRTMKIVGNAIGASLLIVYTPV